MELTACLPPLLCALVLGTAGPAVASPGDRDRGLWIGPIHACRDTASAIAAPDPDTKLATLTFTFAPEMRTALQRETKRLVNQQMPVRLDGRVIMEPRVNEPINGGRIQLRGPSAEEFGATQAASRRPC